MPKKKLSEDSVKVSKIQPPEIVDQLDLIQKLRSDPTLGFYYMNYAVERSSQFFTPYALK